MDGPTAEIPKVETTFLLPDAEATTALGQALAPLVGAGDTLLLSGPIGSGKTHLARALIQDRLDRAGLSEDVPSPTFTLVQTYEAGDLSILHADLYRLPDGSDITELGIGEDDALTLIEWPERANLHRPIALLVRFDLPTDGRGRRVTLSGRSDRWADAIAVLQTRFGRAA